MLGWGCIRYPSMVKDMILIKLRHARAHKGMVKRDFKFVRRATMAGLKEEERQELAINHHSRRGKLRNALSRKKEKILTLTRRAHDCSKRPLCTRRSRCSTRKGSRMGRKTPAWPCRTSSRWSGPVMPS